MPRVTYQQLPRDWVGETAVFIGNGTSIEKLDLSVLRGLARTRVMVTNGGYRFFPDADQLMCSDKHWLAANSHDWSGFTGKDIIVTQPQAVVKRDPRIMYVKRAYIDKLKPIQYFADQGVLTEGHTSTATSMSAAVLRGVGRIILVGVDLAPGANGQRRAGESVKENPRTVKARYAKQADHLTKLGQRIQALGIEVINCSPRSALTAFPYAALENVL